MLDFPQTLTLLKDNYSTRMTPPMLRTEVEAGPVLQRPLMSQGYETRSVKYLIEGADTLAAFRQWLKDIGNGTQFFMWPDPEKLALGLTVEESRVQARIVSGEVALSPVNKRFSAWHVEMTLELFNA